MTNFETPVRLELRLSGARPSFHEVTAAEFLIGSVSGCDLVIPGRDLPPVLGVIARTTDGIRLRKLAPSLKLTVNGKPVHHAPLNNGDSIGIGSAEIVVHLPAAGAQAASASKPWSFAIPLAGAVATAAPPRPVDATGAVRQLRQESERLKVQAREIAAKERALETEEQSRRMVWAERETQLESELDEARRHKASAPMPAQRDLSAQKQAFDESVRTHREDLARLDRHRDAVESREREVERREQQLHQLDERARQLDATGERLREEQQLVRQTQAELDADRGQLAGQLAEVERRDGTLRTLEVRLERLREELARDAQTVTEQKARQDAHDRELILKQQQFDARLAQIELRDRASAEDRKQLDERQTSLQATAVQLKQLQEQLAAQQIALAGQDADVKNRGDRLAADRLALENAVREHREDLARLDRQRSELEGRERGALAREAELKTSSEQLSLANQALDARRTQLAEAEAQFALERDRVTALGLDYEARLTRLDERAATTEDQQAILATLRTKMERMRNELRSEAQGLSEQRTRQETLEKELSDKQKQLDGLKAELELEHENREQERKDFADRSASLQAAVAQLKTVQERIASEEASAHRMAAQVDAKTGEHAEQAETLKARAVQLTELHAQLESERQALRDREQAVAAADESRQALQEQLLHRVAELDERRRVADEVSAELERRGEELAQDRLRVDADLGTTRRDLEGKAAEMERLGQELESREEQLRQRVERLKEVGQTLAAERKARFDAKTQWEEEHRMAAEDLARTRAELDAFRNEALAHATEIQNAVPELEVRGQAALERLAQAREQLKNHVSELHDYARQSHADLDTLRSQVQSETERLRGQQTSLTRARSDHRHAVTAFRQQLIDWQGRVSEMKSSIARDGTRSDKRHSELDDAARDIDATAQQLAQQAAELQAQDEQTPQQLGNLTDMRDWFRRKLQELAESSVVRGPLSVDENNSILSSGLTERALATDDGQRTTDASEILSLRSDVDPGDRKLGELLQSMDLADDDTLSALWLEARRQRRSLRQVLLASGKLTVYQMALIEAGNVDGLTIGPLGVIDRLRSTPHESVYRVIDPRPGNLAGPLVLRHLAEAEMHDAVRPDEFRQRFKALTDVRHPHVAATIEVLEICDRPAALQEWISGLPGTDWPTLAASPGVWYRLTCQALLGLATAHQFGLVHGGISPHSVVLTSDGLVKLAGVGEPAWLTGASAGGTIAGDLLALGRVAAGWAALTPKRKGAKPPRPLPTAVREVLDRWATGGYDSAAAVLDELDRAGTDVPSGAETWERLVKYAGENASDGIAWRKSA